ncbi:MAG TPA: hypothetical protein VGG84_03715 [Gemmatimonadaceae bacterium]|jgi:hypothetical protein
MKPIPLIATTAFVLAIASDTVSAQTAGATHEGFLRPPVFLLMPGALTTCVISCEAGSSRTDFNARFQTVIPTSSSWLSFVAGAQWGWASASAHGPIIFFGGIIPIVPLNNATNGWLTISFDPLGAAAGPGGKGTNLVAEGAAVANIGAKLMPNRPVLRSLGAYFLVDQQLTNVPTDANGRKDHWNPTLIYGLALQIAP